MPENCSADFLVSLTWQLLRLQSVCEVTGWSRWSISKMTRQKHGKNLNLDRKVKDYDTLFILKLLLGLAKRISEVPLWVHQSDLRRQLNMFQKGKMRDPSILTYH